MTTPRGNVAPLPFLARPVNALARRLPAWPVYVLGVLPIAWWFWLGVNGGLGPDPVRTLEREIGLYALQLLAVVLAITPLRRLLGINLLRYRRALALVAFFAVVSHLLVWALLDVQDMALVWEDIVKRPYITIGMLAFVLMLPLALTSSNVAIRRLGARRWRRLHRLTYLIVPLAATHFVMVRKGWQAEPLAWLAIVMILLGLRALQRSAAQPASTT